jgi:putative addiction module killer protein
MRYTTIYSSTIFCRSDILKKWTIEYWNNESGKSPIEKWLDKLTKEQLTSISENLRILERLGNDLKLPHSRALGKGLFELRERQFGYRVYYCFRGNQLIILLAAGDKKSQEKDIKTAYTRLLKDK